MICSLGTALPHLAPCAADLTLFLPIAQRKIPALRIFLCVPCVSPRLACVLVRVFGLSRRVLCKVGYVLCLVGCILPEKIPAFAKVARALPEKISVKKHQLNKFCFIQPAETGIPREFDTVARILPNQIPVRKGIQQEFDTVGRILPEMFCARKGQKLRPKREPKIETKEQLKNGKS